MFNAEGRSSVKRENVLSFHRALDVPSCIDLHRTASQMAYASAHWS